MVVSGDGFVSEPVDLCEKHEGDGFVRRRWVFFELCCVELL